MASFTHDADDEDSAPYDNMNPPAYPGSEDDGGAGDASQQSQSQQGGGASADGGPSGAQPAAQASPESASRPAPSSEGRANAGTPARGDNEQSPSGGPPPHPGYPHPMHPGFLQTPPGYSYDARRLGYPPDMRDHMPPPGMVGMYPYPPAGMGPHGWAPMDMYGRPAMPPPEYRDGRGRMRVPVVGGPYALSRYEDVGGLAMGGSPAGDMKGKGRETGMDDGQDRESKKPAKKTEIACDFCRARKLKCDGIKPQCGQCSQRDQGCAYQPGPPNRRGPGRKNRVAMGDGSMGSPTPPKSRSGKSRKNTNEGLDVENAAEWRQDNMGPPPPPPPGSMGLMGPPGSFQYPPS